MGTALRSEQVSPSKILLLTCCRVVAEGTNLELRCYLAWLDTDRVDELSLINRAGMQSSRFHFSPQA